MSISEAWWLNWEARWLNMGGVVAQSERHGGSSGGMMAQKEPESPQTTANCQSPGGLPPGMSLGCRLTSVRGQQRRKLRKRTNGSPKTYIKKHNVIKQSQSSCQTIVRWQGSPLELTEIMHFKGDFLPFCGWPQCIMTVPAVEDCSIFACSPIQTEKYVVSWISCGPTPYSPHSTAEREGDSSPVQERFAKRRVPLSYPPPYSYTQ